MRITSKSKRLYRIITLVLIALILIPLAASDLAYATTVKVLDGQISVTDTANSNTASDNTVTITAKGGLISQTTNTVTITNNSGSSAVISFDYSAKNYSSFSESSASGKYTSSTLAAGGTITMSIKGKRALTSNTATLTLSNFSLTVAAATSNVTVEYNSSLGSVTVDGNAVDSGYVAQGVTVAEGVILAATANSGAEFVGWINTADNSVIPNSSASFSYLPTADVTLKAVFASASTAPVFFADGTEKVFESFDAAISYASSASNKTITLASDATLAAGNYTIPAGVTLLIPYDAVGTLRTTSPTEHENAYTKPSVFRTLNMAAGANITVNGTLSLSAAVSSKIRYNGMPSGPLPFIKMTDGSKITVENGGNLYTWGYITGSGTVEVKSGGTVYEAFQVGDYRGGDVTTNMNQKAGTYGVFPFTQYYLQNIEVPMTLHAGAKENGFFLVYVSYAGNQHSEVPFIGSDNSMFKISSGYVVKDYIEGTGRTEINIFGDVSVSPISLSLKVSLLGTVTIDSSKYVLPIPNHFTVSIESGAISMDQSLALLPGSELYIREGVTCTLGSGKKIIVYDWDEWQYNDGANGYAGYNERYSPLKYVPGGDGTTGRTKDALVQVDGTIDASSGAVYVTTGGANIYSNGTGVIKLTAGTETTTYQIITNGSDISSWPQLKINPAWLKNGDGNYVQSTTGTYTYCGECLQWLTSHGNATNVELGNSLNMYFAFWSSSITEESKENYYAIITHTDAAGNMTTQTFTHDLWLTTTIKISDTEEQPAYVVPYKGLAAKQMGDTVQVTLYKSGTAMHTWTDSIQDYAMRMLKKYEADENKGTLRTLLVDMLNYGAACQKEFGYDTTHPVNAGLSEVQQDWATETVNWDGISSEDPNYKANLIVDGNIRFAINVNGNLPYTFKNHWDKDRGGDLLYDEAGEYYYVSKLYVADARQAITIIVDGETYTDSVAAYCRRMIDSKQDTNGVFTAFMKFSNSAYNYLHDDEVNRV